MDGSGNGASLRDLQDAHYLQSRLEVQLKKNIRESKQRLAEMEQSVANDESKLQAVQEVLAQINERIDQLESQTSHGGLLGQQTQPTQAPPLRDEATDGAMPAQTGTPDRFPRPGLVPREGVTLENYRDFKIQSADECVVNGSTCIDKETTCGVFENCAYHEIWCVYCGANSPASTGTKYLKGRKGLISHIKQVHPGQDTNVIGKVTLDKEELMNLMNGTHVFKIVTSFKPERLDNPPSNTENAEVVHTTRALREMSIPREGGSKRATLGFSEQDLEAAAIAALGGQSNAPGTLNPSDAALPPAPALGNAFRPGPRNSSFGGSSVPAKRSRNGTSLQRVNYREEESTQGSEDEADLEARDRAFRRASRGAPGPLLQDQPYRDGEV